MKKLKIYTSSNNLYISTIMDYFNVTNTAASIVYNWYNVEGALEDFENDPIGFCEYIDEDLPDMLEAASDPKDANIVAEEFDLWSPFQEDE